MNAAMKLAEARFFLELLDALESRSSSLTNNASRQEESSYLLSAILNAFYSALEQAKPIAGVEAIKEYKLTHPVIFNSKEGLRNITVHERHIGSDHEGYIPPAGNSINFDFRPKPKLITETETESNPLEINLAASTNHYVEIGGALIGITELCFKQYYFLERFLQEHEIGT
jgi:hypothetical protein